MDQYLTKQRHAAANGPNCHPCRCAICAEYWSGPLPPPGRRHMTSGPSGGSLLRCSCYSFRGPGLSAAALMMCTRSPCMALHRISACSAQWPKTVEPGCLWVWPPAHDSHGLCLSKGSKLRKTRREDNSLPSSLDVLPACQPETSVTRMIVHTSTTPRNHDISGPESRTWQEAPGPSFVKRQTSNDQRGAGDFEDIRV